jgi:hypothetical protein
VVAKWEFKFEGCTCVCVVGAFMGVRNESCVMRNMGV